MIRNYQEEISLLAKPPARASLALVGQVFPDGITLRFSGEESAGTKRYPYNKSASFAPGDRVRVEWVNGTYLVAYPLAGGKTK